jgi:hypothetical protein
MHHFNDAQIDVPGRNRKRRDGLAHYRVLALGAPAHSQTRPAIRRRIHARGMIARERILKLRSRRRHGHQRLKPPQLASRPQRRAIRFSSLISLLDFPFLPIAAPVLWRSSWINENERRGRPATGRDPVTAIRLSKKLRETVDNWADKQSDQPGRSKAIRRLVELGLKVKK